MALVTTTLSSAVAVTDNSIVVASATSIAVGRLIFVDGEQMQVQKAWVSGTTVPVARGLGGTVTAAHVASANVVHGDAADFSNPGAGNSPVQLPNVRTRTVTSYSASGAITLPTQGTDAVAIVIGTSTLAMTIAAPSKDIDGSILYIMGNAKSASTFTFASGIGNAGGSYDAYAAQTAGNVGMSVMAVNGFWNLLNGPITGTTTALSVAVS